MINLLRRDAAAGVLNGDLGRAGQSAAADPNRSAGLNGLHGVDQHIEKRLLQTAAVCNQCGDGRVQSHVHIDLFAVFLPIDDAHAVVEHIVQIHSRRLAGDTDIAEGEHLLDDVVDAAALMENNVEQLLMLRRQAAIAQQSAGAAVNVHQGIFYIMSQSGGNLT